MKHVINNIGGNNGQNTVNWIDERMKEQGSYPVVAARFPGDLSHYVKTYRTIDDVEASSLLSKAVRKGTIRAQWNLQSAIYSCLQGDFSIENFTRVGQIFEDDIRNTASPKHLKQSSRRSLKIAISRLFTGKIKEACKVGIRVENKGKASKLTISKVIPPASLLASHIKKAETILKDPDLSAVLYSLLSGNETIQSLTGSEIGNDVVRNDIKAIREEEDRKAEIAREARRETYRMNLLQNIAAKRLQSIA